MRSTATPNHALAIHVICDNFSAHKALAVHKWLLAHPRVRTALHPDLNLLDQPGRAVVPPNCSAAAWTAASSARLDELTTALEE